MSPIILLLVNSMAAPSLGQAAPIIHHTFKDNLAEWAGLGTAAKVSVSHDQAIASPDAGALKFDYDIAKGGLNILYLPMAAGTLAKAKSMKFRVHADNTTSIGVVMQEDGGGRYVALVTAPKDTWQPVELSVDDFALSLDADAPKDPDVKLDMDQVNSIAVIDLSELFVQADTPMLKMLFDIRQGKHTLFVDDFTVSPDALPCATSNAGDDVLVDSLVHPQLSWFGVGGMALSKATGGPVSGTCLKADYHQTPGKIAGMTRSLSPWILTATKAITFDVASAQAATLIVQLEQVDGGKYNSTFSVSPGSTSSHVTLRYSDFKPAEDSADKTGALDVTKVKTMIVLDASGAGIKTEQANTLWLGNIRATAKL